jgi:hypothetical protein
MADLPYSFVPAPGYSAYKVTSLLKDYLGMLMEEPENSEIIDNILKLINDYVNQLKKLRVQNLTQTTKQVYDAIDGFFLNTPEESKAEIQCKAGCTACCFIDVDVSGDEAGVIIDYCRENGIEVDKAYLTEQAAAGRKSYSALSRCVFLKDNLCSIYPVRPIACRKHWVKTDPALCDFSKNIINQVGAFFNVNTEILASAMLNVNEVLPFEKALLYQIDLRSD